MSEAKLKHWPLEEFLAWEERQPGKHELVSGQRLMTGATPAHWLMGANIVAAWKPLLQGSACRSSGAAIRVGFVEPAA